ncbi:hypothetical protein [Streptomyces narbonensis]|uniref:hypothetical protein n=1 Tax=Streptomyces narbonensis TaxID=67333 RepID=UPI0033C2F02E
MKVAILFDGGEYRVHDPKCRDVRREAVKFRDTPWVIDVENRYEANHAMWSDIASDNEMLGTPAHDKLVQEYAEGETTYLPCAKLTE